MTRTSARRAADVNPDPDTNGDAVAGRRHVRTTRRCLRCNREFDSAWAGERICPPCKGTTAWRSGQPTPMYPSRSNGPKGR